MSLKSILRHFQIVKGTIYNRIKRKGLISRILSLWEKISEEEQAEIIQAGFQRQAEGIISLKKYYESTEE